MVVMGSIRDKVREISGFVENTLYFCRPDLQLGSDAFNSALLFSVLTECVNGSQLIFGVYGRGKTSLAEYLHSVFYQIPLSLARKVCIRGDSQLTAEKIKGRPHYGKLHQGIEEVVWQHFVLVPPKTFDELNRVPELSQNIVLNGLGRGEWEYLNGFIVQGRSPFFATCNYPDRANNPLGEGVVDRFDVAVENKFAGVMNEWSLSGDYFDEKDVVLNDESTYCEMVNLLNANKPYDEFVSAFKDLRNRFGGVLEKRSVPFVRDDELCVARQEICKIPFSNDAKTYLSLIIAELNVSSKFGERRRCDPGDDGSGLYLGNLVSLGNSSRTSKSLKKYAQALSWFRGHKEVSFEDAEAVAPYALWHKIELKQSAASRFVDADRSDPEKLYAMKFLLGSGADDLPGVKKRFIDVKDKVGNVFGFVESGDCVRAKDLCETYSNKGKGHPFFVDVAKDLA